MAERKVFNFPSEILSELTLEIEGYMPEAFGRTSKRFVWASCRYCGEPSRLRKAQFSKNDSACHKECRYNEMGVYSEMKSVKVVCTYCKGYRWYLESSPKEFGGETRIYRPCLMCKTSRNKNEHIGNSRKTTRRTKPKNKRT